MRFAPCVGQGYRIWILPEINLKKHSASWLRSPLNLCRNKTRFRWLTINNLKHFLRKNCFQLIVIFILNPVWSWKLVCACIASFKCGTSRNHEAWKCHHLRKRHVGGRWMNMWVKGYSSHACDVACAERWYCVTRARGRFSAQFSLDFEGHLKFAAYSKSLQIVSCNITGNITRDYLPFTFCKDDF